VDQLTEVLSESETHYGQWLSLLGEEKQAVIDSDVRRLVKVLERKTEVMAMLGALEKQRNRLLACFATELRIPVGQLTLTSLAAALSDERSSRIRQSGSALRRLAVKVRRSNQENRMLVTHCLNLVRGALGFFQNVVNPVATYASSGKVQAGSGGGNLVSGVI
jgi:flagellar biosynthesis/type III secretory pathway chaperone